MIFTKVYGATVLLEDWGNRETVVRMQMREECFWGGDNGEDDEREIDIVPRQGRALGRQTRHLPRVAIMAGAKSGPVPRRR